jgi:Glycosyl hydrolases family 18
MPVSRRAARLLLCFVVLLLYATCACGRRRRRSAADAARSSSGFDHPVMTWTEVLREQAGKARPQRQSPTSFTLLGFVTPWNAAGVQIASAEARRGRLDIVAPVTFQVLPPDGLQGGEDFDDEVYTSAARAYPRFLFETGQWSLTALLALEPSSPALRAVVRRIVDAAKLRGCPGVVLELWQALAASGALAQEKARALAVLRALGDAVQEAGVRAVLVLPPYDDSAQAGLLAADFAALRTAFDFFVIMTYDYSGTTGPLAPLAWCERVARFFVDECALGKRVLLGLNFYGVDFAHRDRQDSGHVVGHEYITLLREQEPTVTWIDDYGEDAFSYVKNNTERAVFYPTHRSVRARVKLAMDIGCGGVAVWEVGQGLPWLFDAF